jgi:uncharacterized cysteine cluster protein YcgN (CxxCxxCC family)
MPTQSRTDTPQAVAGPTDSSSDRCRRCGRCCREKVAIEGVIFYTDRVCRFWDPITKLCRVFDRRGDVCHDCADLDSAIRHGILPGDCPYVRGNEDYVPPVEYWEDAEVEAILRSLPRDPLTVHHPRPRR